MAHSDFPVKVPLITDVLARAIHREMMESGKKEFAFPTTFRHSDAGKCGRYLWYEHTETPQSDPVDVSGAWVMWIGTMLHEELQRVLPTRFPGARIEYSLRHGDLSSGRADAFIILTEEQADRVEELSGHRASSILYELKSRNGTQFSKAVGWDKRKFSITTPIGPSSSDRIQGALNATAVDADLLVVGIIGMEAASLFFGDRHGLSDIERILGEWHFTKAEFSPWANRELDRWKWIDMQMSEGIVPDRIAIGDEMEAISLNPNDSRPTFQCRYCSHWTTCKEGQ